MKLNICLLQTIKLTVSCTIKELIPITFQSGQILLPVRVLDEIFIKRQFALGKRT
jgi:hypothetical protein